MIAPDDAFVRLHEPMIRRTAAGIARSLNHPSLADDLVGIGFEALLDARTRFDESRGVPFEGFAYYRVRGAMLKEGPRIDGISPKTMARVLRAGDAAAEELGRERATRDDSDEIDRAALGFEKLFGQVVGSLVVARFAEEEQTPESKLFLELERARVRKAILSLDPRDRDLLHGLYFQERTLADLGAELGLTESGASRAHTRVLAQLRDALGPPS